VRAPGSPARALEAASRPAPDVSAVATCAAPRRAEAARAAARGAWGGRADYLAARRSTRSRAGAALAETRALGPRWARVGRRGAAVRRESRATAARRGCGDAAYATCAGVPAAFWLVARGRGTGAAALERFATPRTRRRVASSRALDERVLRERPRGAGGTGCATACSAAAASPTPRARAQALRRSSCAANSRRLATTMRAPEGGGACHQAVLG
jgi:hypothetical protein